MTRFLIPVGVLLAIAALLGVGLGLNPSGVPSPFVGKSAPELTGPRLYEQGQRYDMPEQPGEPMLVNVWASWCVACRHEHPLLTRLAEQGVRVIGLNYKDEPEAAMEWLRDWGDPYELVVQDPKGQNGLEWGVYGVPETFVIDAEGVIRYKHTGALTRQAIREHLAPHFRDISPADWGAS